MKATIAIKSTTAAALLALGMTTATSFGGTTANLDGTTNSPSVAPPVTSGGTEGGWKFQINLNYANGLSDLGDSIEARNPMYEVDTVIPVGLSFLPYYEFANGFGIGMEVGPALIGLGDAEFYVVPVSLDFRYTFNREGSVSPYIRAGAQYAFAGGDFIDSGDVGFYAKAGLEFGHSRNFGWGFEVGYASTTIEVLPGAGKKAEDIEPYNFTAGLFVRF